jgi:hypothetical protein
MDDPLPHLTAGLQALLRRQAELDRMEIERRGGAADATPAIAQWRETNLGAIDHLERAIAAVSASGARDAVVQVLIAAGRVQGLGAQTCERALAEELAVVRLLLRSALPALARGAGVDLAACGADHYGQSGAGAPFSAPPRGGAGPGEAPPASGG